MLKFQISNSSSELQHKLILKFNCSTFECYRHHANESIFIKIKTLTFNADINSK